MEGLIRETLRSEKVNVGMAWFNLAWLPIFVSEIACVLGVKEVTNP